MTGLLPTLVALWAQGDTNLFTGAGGWAGAGLLGLVLGWLLLKHLPDKDRQLKELLDMKDRQIESLSERFSEQLLNVVSEFKFESAEAKKEFKESLNLVLQHCERETARQAEVVHKRLESLEAIFKRR